MEHLGHFRLDVCALRYSSLPGQIVGVSGFVLLLLTMAATRLDFQLRQARVQVPKDQSD